MTAADFVLATLSHFVRRVDGPWPGMPARADAHFETEVASICIHQEITPLIHGALSAQALGPGVSPVTMSRLSDHREAVAGHNAMRVRRLGKLLDTLDAAGVPALLMGDILSHATLYDATGHEAPRSIRQLDLLVGEDKLADALPVLNTAGFSGRRTDPSFGPRAGVVDFHHYVAPLLLWNADGDRLRVRLRVVDVGRPRPDDHVWDRRRTVSAWGRNLEAVSLEDHLLQRALRLGVSGYSDLSALTDVGLILDHHAKTVDWGYFAYRARAHGVYTAAWHALRYVRRALDLRVAAPLAPPARAYQRWLDVFRDADSIDYVTSFEKRRRFFYGLVACGGVAAKLRWLWYHCVPRREWVECVVGDASSPWSWLRYHAVVHGNSRARREARRRAILDRGNVTRIDGGD